MTTRIYLLYNLNCPLIRYQIKYLFNSHHNLNNDYEISKEQTKKKDIYKIFSTKRKLNYLIYNRKAAYHKTKE